MTEEIPYKQLPGQQQPRPSQSRAPVFVCAVLLLGVTAGLLTTMAVLTLLTTPPEHQTTPPEHRTSPSLVQEEPPCTDPCRLVLLESIPEGVTFNSSSTHMSIFQAWQNLMSEASSSLDIASFYWTLTNTDTGTHEASAAQGEAVLQNLADLSPKLNVRIAVNTPQGSLPADLQLLSSKGAQIRTCQHGLEIAHTGEGAGGRGVQLQLSGRRPGEDLRGVLVPGTEPEYSPTWPSSFSTSFNQDSPLQLRLNDSEASVYLSSSPPSLCASGRTSDLQAILGVIQDAQSFVYIAVMNYLPTMEFSHPKNTQPVMFPFLRSLASLQDPRGKLDVQVRLFVVPATAAQKEIPFARVNHNKYMVTDKVAYIGTSNWSGDYFVNTAGVALVVQQPPQSETGATVQEQLRRVFERDWNSDYSSPLSHHPDAKDKCPV
ncbi:hypothetical protein WMY93_028200 [Mugilogobius chulae]|uniref:5'-3' exonuclease PLD3 n=1 Tax=Mugilogobius chulae TaxID=88201 RepID=A0AAW0MZI8_9GOBI